LVAAVTSLSENDRPTLMRQVNRKDKAMAKEYGIADALPASTRGGAARAYDRFTVPADAHPGKFVTFSDVPVKQLGPIVNALRKRGYEAAQRGGVLYVSKVA